MFKAPYTDRRHRAIEYLKTIGRVRYNLEYRNLKIKVVYVQYFG